MAKTSKTMLNNSGESGHPCLVPDLRGNGFSYSPLRMMLAVGLSYMAFITVLCDHLEGWDREAGREAQEGRDMGIYVYI